MRLPSRATQCLLLLALTEPWSHAFSANELTFETEVRPILKAACFHCHGEDDVKKSGLDVRLVRLMIVGGKSGTVLSPGDPEASLLWKKIAKDEMPKGKKKLSNVEKERIREWIAQGSKTARPEPDNVKEARFTPEELNHWAFQPLKKPIVGSNEDNPIDSFISARLSAKGLKHSKPADRRTLIRRLSFNLTGLPPTTEEIEAFVVDTPGAYERLVDRLLKSPQYGVRWARHWLDAAGFSESDGFELSDAKRPYAWRYRDYVIESFNANKPINEFIVEQLAGDEMIEGNIDTNNPRHLELLTATGFLRMAPDATQRSNTLTDRNTAVSNTLQIVSRSLLGITVGCAQCHDHKYDPIGTDDYYRFRAVFDPAFPLEKWQQPEARLIDMTTVEVRSERARIESEAKKLEDDLVSRRQTHCEQIQKLKLEDVPEEIREATREAVLTKSEERNQEQKQLLATYPMVKTISFIIGQLVEYDGKAYREFQEEQKKIDAVRAKKPPLRMIRMTTEADKNYPVSKVFFRGNPNSPRDAVMPAELMVLKQHRNDVVIPENEKERKTSGRRLAYARQLTDGTHPMTARVFVNRVWMHHFGRGLVITPGDFGIAGEKPSHPELLDWLASDFVSSGWDMKRMHRMILLSKTYRQISQRRPKLDQIDPDNTLLGRANLRRLEAEAIRDFLLKVTGKLDPKLGGPSNPVTENSEGKATLEGNKTRRSIFVEVQRRLPLNMLATFDQPAMTPNCNQRSQTTVATQALWFLNDKTSLDHSEDMARLLTKHSSNQRAQLKELFLRLFAQPPTTEELMFCQEFLTHQDNRIAKQNPDKDSKHLALASLCQALFSSNRFLFID